MSETALPPRDPRASKPVEVMEGARPFRVVSVSLSIIIASGVALVLGSGALLDWASVLPVGPISDFLVDLAQRWHESMTEAGFSQVSDWIREALHALQGMRQ